MLLLKKGKRQAKKQEEAFFEVVLFKILAK